MTHPSVAQQFVRARLNAAALREFPGPLPSTLEAAYAHQQEAIGLWPDSVAGWKIGRIGPPWQERFGEERLVGPVFHREVRRVAPGEVSEYPVFEGGFAAVEAEFVFLLTADAPRRADWTAAQAAQLACDLHIGIETAGSPLASINDLGPTAIISDFGNNAGLLLGPRIPDWRARPLESLATETFIEGGRVGRGGAVSVPGGPLAGLAYALDRCARLGWPLKQGDLVSSGATTGVHEIRIGQRARARFEGIGELECRAYSAKAGAFG